MTTARTTARPTALATALTTTLTVLFLTSGCSSDGAAEDGSQDAEARSKIIQPGRPGESNETLDPDTKVQAAPANDADVMFMQMMIPHHAQALEMSELAQTRAADRRVVALARRIKGAQGPEIRSMSAWLQRREEVVPESMADVPGHGAEDGEHEDHGERAEHGSADGAPMAGMLSARQMRELAAARGARFDRLFLEGMIQHHRGAIDMAHTEMDSGSEQLAMEMAADIATGQLAEIDRMRDVLRTL